MAYVCSRKFHLLFELGLYPLELDDMASLIVYVAHGLDLRVTPDNVGLVDADGINPCKNGVANGSLAACPGSVTDGTYEQKNCAVRGLSGWK